MEYAAYIITLVQTVRVILIKCKLVFFKQFDVH